LPGGLPEGRLGYAPAAYLERPTISQPGNTLLPLGVGPCRYLQVYGHESFLHLGPMAIRELRWRPARGSSFFNLPGGSFEAELRIGLTPVGNGPGQTLTHFGSNFATIQTVIQRKWLSYPGSGSTLDDLRRFEIRLPFDAGQSFVYDSSSGRDLVIELRVYASKGTLPLDFATNNEKTLGPVSAPASTFEGCASSTQSQPQYSGAPLPYLRVGSGVMQGVTFPKPGATMITFFGVRAQWIPFGNCVLTNDALDIRTTTIPSFGYAQYLMTIPNDPGLAGVSFFLQTMCVEGLPQRLDISSTPGVVHRIAIDPQRLTVPNVARAWVLTPTPDLASRASNVTQNGLVTAFVY
jgi:hypothetical protein